MNIEKSVELIRELARRGVREICSCAGARNSPIVAVLERTSGLRVFSFFEERSAAFFALGRTRESGRPVAVITTSGTAAAELLPAVIEAHYTGFPLIVVTADRPRRLRGTGAPQCIVQPGLFGPYVEREFDIENEPIELGSWSGSSPLHLNICFDEPLLDAPVPRVEIAGDGLVSSREESLVQGAGSRELESAGPRGLSDEPESMIEKLHRLKTDFFDQVTQPFAVVGTLDTEAEREAVVSLLLRWKMPAYLEAPSGLRGDARLERFEIRSGDRYLSWLLAGRHADGVLRLGGVPSARIWRDLENPSSRVPVASISRVPFSGLARGTFIHASLEALAAQALLNGSPIAHLEYGQTPDVLAFDREQAEAIEQLFLQEPLAEPSLIHHLSKLFQADTQVYLGNSLPIREWDLAAVRQPRFRVAANRGANGIDGQLSTFFGLAREGVENWAVVGDLTTMYDLAAPWALPLRPEVRSRVVIVNNSGGRIFSRIFGNPLFENRHSIGFRDWAAMWSLGYERWDSIPEHGPADGTQVIELIPNAAATDRFWNRFDSLWRSE